jgi:hypothetical protein
MIALAVLATRSAARPPASRRVVGSGHFTSAVLKLEQWSASAEAPGWAFAAEAVPLQVSASTVATTGFQLATRIGF